MVTGRAITAVLLGVLSWTGVPAIAATAPLSHARIVAHFDLAAGQLPESAVPAPLGAVDVVFAVSRQVARISADGTTRVLATLPAPVEPVGGFSIASGLVRSWDGTFYIAYAAGTADLTGVWRVRPGGNPERIAALPAAGLPNGMDVDPRTGDLYVADSALSVIWRVPAEGGDPVAWARGAELSPTGSLGVNGLKIHNGAVWATNTDQGTLLRIPLRGNGKITVKARGLAGADDFAFIDRRDTALVALNGSNQVVLVEPDGSHSVVLDGQDGLQGPSTVVVRGRSAYVASAAFVRQHDPNLLVADLGKP
ncbi:hypothetical protein [Lentzea sp. NBRC 102530]|uniref:hypothetical protein n=1 Tax=Lentzea sp. NBRC 102530 TaxID=3032201 RepID=UPI0024A4F81B|nr:hypothetical protein [Lentzea sp. NBRC 102530]GLY49814.1 hypothetical protein Lesp01_34700 [Lentzea sp. NBRC 102530]